MEAPLAKGVIAVIVKGYPRLSETFIAQELLALERRGLVLALFSLRHPTERERHPIHAEIRAPVVYLPEYLHDEPARVWRAWRKVRRLPGYSAARNAWWRDLVRDRTRSRVRRFGQALVLAAEMPEEVVHLHAHFLHTPASVARYAAILSARAWSCSAHAKDVWTTPEWDLREKLDGCAWTTTCTAVNATRLRELAGPAREVDLNYHGIDVARFQQPAGARRSSDGGDMAAPVILLAVGRAVDKKGFDDLLRALALIPREVHWRMIHIGDGPLRDVLEAMARTMGLSGRIEWRGPQPHGQVLDAYRASDIFVLPCRVSADGDRDGLPNVLLEAQSQSLVCVSTRISGIPELIEDGTTGLLVDPCAPKELAEALCRLITDPELRQRLGEAGFARTRQRFSMDAGADRLTVRFKAMLGKAMPASAASR